MYVNRTTKKEIKIGDTVETFRGEPVVVTDFADLIYINIVSGIPTRPYGVYPGVINAEWVEQLKPHYMRKGGIWWVFKSRKQSILFLASIRAGNYDHTLEPRQVVLTEAGLL